MKLKPLATLLVASAIGTCPAIAADEAPLIHGHIVGPAAWVDYISGIYNFRAESPLSLVMQKESRFIHVNGGGDLIEDMYYYISDNDGLGSAGYYRMYVYDAATWIPKNNFSVPDRFSASDFTYDRTTGRLYGTFTNDDGATWHFGHMNPATAQFTPIAHTEAAYPAIATRRDGTIYAIDAQGRLLQLNKSTGEAIELLATPFTPVGMQTACFDPQTDTLYWCFRDSGDDTSLLSIDLNNLASGVTVIAPFPEAEVVGGAYIEPLNPDETTSPAAPALTVTAGATGATVAYTMPTATLNGTPLSGSVDYTLYVDGFAKTSDTTNPGQSFTETMELPTGEHIVTVMCDNGNQPSQFSTQIVYTGFDTPSAVTNLTSSRTGNTLTATWTPPTTGVNGGAIHTGSLLYEVTLQAGTESNSYSTTEPRFEIELTGEAPANCMISVTVVDGALRSKAVDALPIMMGTPYALPYSANFSDESQLADILVVDANTDGSTWYYEEINHDLRTGYKYDVRPMDDWAYLPILALNPDRFYCLKYSTQTAGASYVEEMEIKAGLRRDANDMTVEISPRTPYASSAQTANTAYFTVPDSNPWHIGFHSMTEGENLYLAIDNISVTDAGSSAAPAKATDISCTPDADGALTCTMHLTAPSTAINGSPLQGNITVRVSRSGRKQKEIANVVPGSTISIEGLVGTQGTNNYEVVCIDSEKRPGMPITVAQYLGQDVPLPPTNVSVEIDADGNRTITWEAPTGGRNGGVVDPSQITYSVRRSFDTQYVTQNTKLLSASDRAGLYDDVEQAIMYYQVYATNPAGTSEPGESRHFIMGNPYALPFKDSFKDAMEMQGPWLGLMIDNGRSAWYLDSEGTRPSCDPVNNDGGLLTFAPGQEGHTSTVSTPLVCIDGAAYPTLEFYFYATPQNDSRLEVTLTSATITEPEELASISVNSNMWQGGWNKIQIPLLEFQGQKHVQIHFTGFAGQSYDNHICLDHISISDVNRYDIGAMHLEHPERLTPGKEATFIGTIANVGVDAVKDVEVTLLREGIAVCTRIIPEVAPQTVIAIDLTDEIDLTAPEMVYYALAATSPDDSNEENELSDIVGVEVDLPHFPVPQLNAHLESEATGTMAVLQWTLGDITGVRAPVVDNFESYEPFIIDNVGEWTLTDIDGSGGTNGVLNGSGDELSYPNMGAPMAYQVFNPLMAGLEVADEYGRPTITAAHSGNQMLTAFCDIDAYNNDWLISPRLTGQAQTITFWAKSYTSYYGLEAFIIMVSDSDTATTSFRELTPVVNAPDEWTRYQVDLPAGVRHFAIRCVSIDQFGFCVDDIKFTPESSEAVDLTVAGFNIYSNGKLCKTVSADERSARISVDQLRADADESGMLNLTVTANYHIGESLHSSAVTLDPAGIEDVATNTASAVNVRAYRGGIEVTGTESDSVTTIYTTDGRIAATLRGDGRVPLAGGLYVVAPQASAPVKALVR